MSELQLSMIALGVVTVGGVWAYNAWQGRRHRKLAEGLTRREVEDVEDVLLRGTRPEADDERPAAARVGSPAEPGAARVEPRLGDLPPVDALPPAGVAVPIDRETAEEAPPRPPMAEPGANPFEPERAPAAPALAGESAEPAEPGAELADPERLLPSQLLSPAADYIAAFESMEPIPGEQILEAQGELMRAVGKRIAWVGFDETLPGWEFCRNGAAYRRLRIGVQLADRSGPIAEASLDLFYRAMQSFADEITAVADLPPKRVALETAQRLDRVCAGVDIQVGVNVVSKGAPFTGTKIRALAEAAGMAIEADGAYVRRDDDGRLLYTLHAHDGVGFTAEAMRSLSSHGLTFLLDVPRVANGDRIFNQMVEVARRFAETLQGQLVDDNRRPITEQFLGPIRKQIGQYQATMATQGLPAGSDVALRLFA